MVCAHWIQAHKMFGAILSWVGTNLRLRNFRILFIPGAHSLYEDLICVFHSKWLHKYHKWKTHTSQTSQVFHSTVSACSYSSITLITWFTTLDSPRGHSDPPETFLSVFFLSNPIKRPCCCLLRGISYTILVMGRFKRCTGAFPPHPSCWHRSQSPSIFLHTGQNSRIENPAS